eukprot:gene553-biopygen1353
MSWGADAALDSATSLGQALCPPVRDSLEPLLFDAKEDTIEPLPFDASEDAFEPLLFDASTLLGSDTLLSELLEGTSWCEALVAADAPVVADPRLSESSKACLAIGSEAELSRSLSAFPTLRARTLAGRAGNFSEGIFSRFFSCSDSGKQEC